MREWSIIFFSQSQQPPATHPSPAKKTRQILDCEAKTLLSAKDSWELWIMSGQILQAPTGGSRWSPVFNQTQASKCCWFIADPHRKWLHIDDKKQERSCTNYIWQKTIRRYTYICINIPIYHELGWWCFFPQCLPVPPWPLQPWWETEGCGTHGTDVATSELRPQRWYRVW